MTVPEGNTRAREGQVCLLKRSVYGLKQASREWNTELYLKLVEYGFTQSCHDHCLFVKSHAGGFLTLLVYVDDVLIIGSHDSDIEHLKAYLDRVFTIKDLCFDKYFLGVEIARSEQGTYLNQRKYILDILKDVGLQEFDTERYHRLIGRLLYLNFTHSDITFAVQQLSQYVGNPHYSHWDVAVHVLRYLKRCPSLGLFYSSSSPCTLTAYSDADWGTCPDTRKSLTGFCIFLGTSLISWKTKKQNTVSLSSVESEYRAHGAVVGELQWIFYVTRDLQRTKHLDIDCHIVCNLFKDGFFVLQHVRSRNQLADVFTKSLGGPQFQMLLSKFGLRDFHRCQT
ncbi:hypothetical protein DH2020_034479 [Rehmannia glutinosa]|uniref:Reverse transcriptase Ty1/copia-type domain-containing protein n=1 Tax=Rehmannia glutinosa TaxID=99300 RepID=A0ABR0V972_REHGL